ncbi:MAG: adenylate/guanylate cyclase domain-containing protein [Thermoplasmata archaeon]
MASTRRLSAIMFTDMVGSTTMAQANEAAALKLRDEQADLVRPLFVAHQGREIKSMGDGFLAEFDSALRAVECSVDIQQQLHERNTRPSVTPIQLRIGIHLGDVEQRGSDIFGDAVNIASRIEPIAIPGGICVSGAVYEQVRNKIPVRFEKLPPTRLKGVDVAMEVYKIPLPWNAPETSPPSSAPTGVAVLPFANISPDTRDEYFADGLTEELITVLSQIPGLRVIARTSVMQYRSTTKPVSQIGAELGVAAVLEGSVRKAGNRLRITAQLIDAGTQGHLWANSFDRDLDDIFALQSEMAKNVAGSLKVTLLPREEVRLAARRLPKPESYLEYLRGRASLHDSTQEAAQKAKEHFERAIQLDEGNAAAHAGLADFLLTLGDFYRILPHEELWAASRQHAARAIELDPNLAEARASMGLIQVLEYDHAGAEKEFTLALSLNPSYAWARGCYASLLADQCRTEEALREYEVADQLDPLSGIILQSHLSLLVVLRKLDAAAVLLKKIGRADNFGLLYHIARSNLSVALDDSAEVLKEIDWLAERTPGRQEPAAAYALYCARVGQRDRARELLRPLEKLPEASRPDTQIAMTYAFLGDLDACFRWLESAVDGRKVSILWFRLDPLLAFVREDPRFEGVLKRMNLA